MFEDKKKVLFYFTKPQKANIDEQVKHQESGMKVAKLSQLNIGKLSMIKKKASHVRSPSLGTQLGGYTGNMPVHTSSPSNSPHEKNLKAFSVKDALKTARLSMTLNSSSAMPVNVSKTSANSNDVHDNANERECKRVFNRKQIMQGEQIRILVQVDISDEFDVSVLEAIRELDVQVRCFTIALTLLNSKLSLFVYLSSFTGVFIG